VKNFVGFLKRNTPVFLLGLIILIVFLLIIVSDQQQIKSVPANFKKVSDEVFNQQEPTQPLKDKPIDKPYFAPQEASPANKGTPYFYGESNPDLRDEQGYPMPPKPGSSTYSSSVYPEIIQDEKSAEQEEYERRLKDTVIEFNGTNFSPTDASGYTGQKIIWVNRSKNDVEIKQVSVTHKALKEPFLIKPGGSFEFRPLVNGRFVLIEIKSMTYGTVYIADVTTPLLSTD